MHLLSVRRLSIVGPSRKVWAVAGLPVSDNSINIQRRHGYTHQGIPICAWFFPGACWCLLVLVSILVTSAVRIWEIGLSFTILIISDCYGS